MNPDMNPAKNMRPGVGCQRSEVRLTATAPSTDRPIHSASQSLSIHSSIAAPSKEPGTRPITALPNPRKDTWLL